MSADWALLDGTAPRFGDLRRRVLSAALLVPPQVAAMVLGGPVWVANVLILVGLMGWEWIRLCRAARRPTPPLLLPAGLCWIGAAGVAMLELRLGSGAGAANTLFFCLVVAVADVGGYAFGRWLGGPRLAPSISPNKTWAGAAGGLLSAMAVGGVAGYALQPAGAGAGGMLWGALPVAALLATVAMAGDLFESWVKRRCDVKDSSGLLPGHGGVLDRLDGLITAAPAAALLAALAPIGAPLWWARA